MKTVGAKSDGFNGVGVPWKFLNFFGFDDIPDVNIFIFTSAD